MGTEAVGAAPRDSALGINEHHWLPSVPCHGYRVWLHCGFLLLRTIKTILSLSHRTLADRAKYDQLWVLEWPSLGGGGLRNFRASPEFLRTIRHLRASGRAYSRTARELAHSDQFYLRRIILSRHFNRRAMVHHQILSQEEMGPTASLCDLNESQQMSVGVKITLQVSL